MLIACFYLPEIGIAVELARVPFHKGEPLALASANGIVEASSKEAQAAGVVAGMTITGARALCRNLVVLPYSRSVYEEASEAVWDLLATESSLVEPVSPEMSFIELSSIHAMQQAESLSILLAKKIGIPIQVGIGSSKLVAEHAARQKNQQSLVSVQLGMEAVFLASVPIGALQTINEAAKQRLMKLGINTLGDILRLPEGSLSYQFKDVARKLQQLAVGDDGSRVRPLWPPRAIEHEFVFDEETGRLNEINEAIRVCALHLSKQLTFERTYCRKVRLRVVLTDGSEIGQVEQFRGATNLAEDLMSAGQRLFRRVVVEYPITSVTLIASGLGAGSGFQLSLISEGDQTRQEQLLREQKLEETVAYVKKRFGVSAVVTASLFKTVRQINLWTYPLGQQKRESVLVATDQSGAPKRFYRYKNAVHSKHDVTEIQEQWNQAVWSWEKILETHCYRVVTDPWGLHQLEQLGVEWTLTGTAD